MLWIEDFVGQGAEFAPGMLIKAVSESLLCVPSPAPRLVSFCKSQDDRKDCTL